MRTPIPEPAIGSTIRVCSTDAKKQARIGARCQVIARIGPNTFHLRRELPDGAEDWPGNVMDWVERVESWVNVPLPKEVAS